ncbi:MAG: glycosyltransferase, partial [Candidatus Magnetominusculus sp. LBB02]|nr:glycosyltransferase [Candidatus Magnetominusculus sp. LBB02]
NARFLAQPLTGVQRFALEISRRISQNDISLVAPKGVSASHELKPLQYGSLKGHLWEQIDLLRYLKAHNNPLLFNLTQTSPFLYERFALTVHDVAFLINPMWYAAGIGRLYSVLIPMLAKKAVRIITSSQFSKGEIVKHCGVREQKIEVIQPGVSDDFCQRAKAGFAEPLGDYILAVASLNPRKNLRKLIRAFKSCRFDGIKLVVVGAADSVYPGR